MQESALKRMLKEQDEVFVYNDWEDTAIRFEKKDGKITAFIKPYGQKEQKIEYTEAHDYALGGREMTKEQYEKY